MHYSYREEYCSSYQETPARRLEAHEQVGKPRGNHPNDCQHTQEIAHLVNSSGFKRQPANSNWLP